jgi:hypothetical protein
MKLMRATVAIAFAFLIIPSQGTTAFGQRKLIGYKEYYDAIARSPEVGWSERTHRVETLEEELSNGAVIRSDLEVSEVVLPDRQRYYKKTVSGGKVKEFEQITIEYFQYTRVDGGEWSKVDLRQQKPGVGYGSSTGSGSSRIACTQYSVEPVVIGGLPVKLYEMIDIESAGNELKLEEKRSWKSDEGLPYRTEHVKGFAFPRAETWREVVTYDYSTDLKINAPID